MSRRIGAVRVAVTAAFTSRQINSPISVTTANSHSHCLLRPNDHSQPHRCAGNAWTILATRSRPADSFPFALAIRVASHPHSPLQFFIGSDRSDRVRYPAWSSNLLNWNGIPFGAHMPEDSHLPVTRNIRQSSGRSSQRILVNGIP